MRACAVIVALTGGVVLFGWAFHRPLITTVLPGLTPMRPWTALALLLSGVALGARTWRPRVMAIAALERMAAAMVALISGLSVFEYASGRDLGVDTLLLPHVATVTSEPDPGRMGLNTAMALLAVSVGLLLKSTGVRRNAALAELTGIVALMIALLPALGYLYSAPSLTGTASYSQMAMHSALALLVVSIGLIAAAPHGPMFNRFVSTGPGGVMLRRFSPIFCVLFILVSWFRLVGQLKGFYDLELGLAMMVTVGLAIFGVGALFTARALDRATRRHHLLDRQLHERELRYRMIVDATFDGVVISQRGRIKEANAGYAAMFGYAPDELPGKSVYELVAGESMPLVKQRIASGQGGAYSAVGIRKDGSHFTIDTVVRVHGEGEDQLRVAALRDTSREKALESQLRQAQKMEAIGQLAGGLAHDFNNLLTVILSYTSMLQEDGAVTSERIGDLVQIEGAARSAAGLTRQLLAFSRQQVLQPQVVSLNAIVEDTKRLLRRLIGEDVELRSVLAPTIDPILADPGQLEQVILNLAVNARDAMPMGGSLVIETANVRLDADYVALHPGVTPGRYVQLIVTDSGTGMDDATLAHIFEPFFTTKAVGKGTGLGLASVYGVVQQMGGHIWVYSEIGHGTTFKLYFPALLERTALTPASSPAIRSRAGTETILLAEDAMPVRELAESVLRSAGYTVLSAKDGEAALIAADMYPGDIQLLLTDVVMPGVSGREVADILTVARPTLRVLFVSGYTNDTVLQRGILGAGMTLLQKPFTPESLRRAVREALDAE